MIKKYSITALFACCLFIFFIGLVYYPKWKQPATEATISWDVSGYYLYLPALFIYKDLKQCRFVDTVLEKYRPTPDFQQAFRHSSGNIVMKYTMGQAILFAPFFFIGHLVALATNFQADGFSVPYQLSIGLGMLFYSFVGLWFLRKFLLRFFSDPVVALTLLVLVFATNYLNYAAIDGAMTHNSLFMLYAMLLYYTDKFYYKAGVGLAIRIGLIAGLITLIRPTEIICLIIPIIWGIKNVIELKQRLAFFRRKYKLGILMLVCFGMAVLLQLIYWKWSSGQWIVYSYQQEGFNWLHPNIINGLISYKGGWLTYTPIMILLFPGLAFLGKMGNGLFLSVLVFSMLFIYICFSWTAWWYGASLGQRALIQAYPVFSIAIASFFSVIPRKGIVFVLASCFIGFCCWYNLWLTHQAHRGSLLRAGEMNSAYFWKIFGKYKVPNDVQGLLDNAERLNKSNTQGSILSTSPASITEKLSSEHQYSTEYIVLLNKNDAWVRAILSVTSPQKEWDIWKMPQALIKFYLNNKVVKLNMVRISRQLSDGQTGVIEVDAKVPPNYDKVSVSVWNADSKKEIFINRVSVYSFKY